jgi:hypothetical protein
MKFPKRTWSVKYPKATPVKFPKQPSRPNAGRKGKV